MKANSRTRRRGRPTNKERIIRLEKTVHQLKEQFKQSKQAYQVLQHKYLEVKIIRLKEAIANIKCLPKDNIKTHE